MNTLPEENLVVIQPPSQADRSKNSRNSTNSQAVGCDSSQIEWPEPDELSVIGEHKEYPVGAFPDDVAKVSVRRPPGNGEFRALSSPSMANSWKFIWMTGVAHNPVIQHKLLNGKVVLETVILVARSGGRFPAHTHPSHS